NKIPIPDFKAYSKKKILSSWNLEWSYLENNKLHEIKAENKAWHPPYEISRKKQVCLTRLRIGHTNLTHVFLMKKENPPLCEICHEPVTMEHILMKCPRLRFRPSNFPLSSVSEILKNDPDSVTVVLRFLKRNNFMRMI
ncbi:hypothetical protein WDU94_007809, partial [Cyamophila willieti]